MFTPVVLLSVSMVMVVFLMLLFRYEETRGIRVVKNFRLHLDYYLLKIEHGFSHFFRFISMDLLRQVMHYTFHSVLGVLLFILKRYEKRIQEIQRSNRMRARKSRMERTTRNKLDEVAEHKIAVALTEEEKKHRREKTLLGG